MLRPTIQRGLLSRSFYSVSTASVLTSRSRRGGFIQALIPLIGAVAPTVIDWISKLFGGGKKEQEGSGIGFDPLSLLPFPHKLLGINGPSGTAVGSGMKFVKRTGGGIFDWLGTAFNKVKNWISPLVSQGVSAAKSLIPKIREIVPQVVDVGSKVINAVQNRDFSKIGEIVDQGKDIFRSGVNIGKEVYNRGRKFGRDVYDRYQDARVLADEGIQQARELGNRVMNGAKGIREVLNHNRKLRQMEEDKKYADVVQESQERQLNQIREARNANRLMKGANYELNDGLRPYGSETTMPYYRDQPYQYRTPVVTMPNPYASAPQPIYNDYEQGQMDEEPTGSGLIRKLLKKHTRKTTRRGKGIRLMN